MFYSYIAHLLRTYQCALHRKWEVNIKYLQIWGYLNFNLIILPFCFTYTNKSWKNNRILAWAKGGGGARGTGPLSEGYVPMPHTPPPQERRHSCDLTNHYIPNISKTVHFKRYIHRWRNHRGTAGQPAFAYGTWQKAMTSRTWPASHLLPKFQIYRVITTLFKEINK